MSARDVQRKSEEQGGHGNWYLNCSKRSGPILKLLGEENCVTFLVNLIKNAQRCVTTMQHQGRPVSCYNV